VVILYVNPVGAAHTTLHRIRTTHRPSTKKQVETLLCEHLDKVGVDLEAFVAACEALTSSSVSKKEDKDGIGQQVCMCACTCVCAHLPFGVVRPGYLEIIETAMTNNRRWTSSWPWRTSSFSSTSW